MQFKEQLVDRFGRKITYVRFSITPRCNFDCFYCSSKKPQDALVKEFNLEDIDFLFSGLAKVGINKLRLTGGEPLIRQDITEIVRTARARGIEEVVLTTNGFRLFELASQLKEAGLSRANISLDTLRPEVFKRITGVDAFESVYKGIFKSIEVGLNPVKINTVLLNNVNNDDLLGLAKLSIDYPITVRFIELMPTKDNDSFKKHFLGFKTALSMINSQYDLVRTTGNDGEVASYYQIPNAKGKIGFITPVSQHFCAYCNRIRITSRGEIYPCLFSPIKVDIFKAVRLRDLDLLISRIYESVAIKPESHSLISSESTTSISNMRELGG
ncbi:MAG: GTP 3',8-cyclase MoaA [Caldisericaceae bacterium]